MSDGEGTPLDASEKDAGTASGSLQAEAPPVEPGSEGPRYPFIERMRAVLEGRPGVFADIGADCNANGQCSFAVALSYSLVGSLGSLLTCFIWAPAGLLLVFIQSACILLATKILAPERPGFMSIYRVMAFAASPLSLGIVPLVGTVVGYPYTIILQVAALRELCKVSLGRAYAVLAISWVVPFAILVMVILMALSTLAIWIPFLPSHDSHQGSLSESVPSVAGTDISSQPAYAGGAVSESDCAGWNTREFHESATPLDLADCLSVGSDPNARDESGSTPLLLVADRWRDGQSVRTLLDAGADPNAADNGGLTALHVAAARSFRLSDGGVRELLESGADPNARNGNGSTPLHIAAAERSWEVAEALLAAGADPNARNGNGSTPLHIAAAEMPEGPVEILLAGGADPDARDSGGASPLHRAVQMGTRASVEALLDAGAEIDARDTEGKTPIAYYFADTGGTGRLELMIERGADVDARDYEGRPTGVDPARVFEDSCTRGPTWCPSIADSLFNKQTRSGKTASLCEIADEVEYLFGIPGQEPELRYSAPVIAEDTVRTAQVYLPDEGASAFPVGNRDSGSIALISYRTGLFEQSLYAFKRGGWEYHLLRSWGRPMAGYGGSTCTLYVIGP